MAKIRRNGPCPCGSGTKAKRCCHGSSEATEGHCLPSEFLVEVEPDLMDADAGTLRALFSKVHYLPGSHATLRIDPETLTPAEGRAIRAILSRRVDVSGEVIAEVCAEVIRGVLATVDSPARRVELASAVLSLRDEGRIPPDLAAVAVLELDREESKLFLCSAIDVVMPPDGEDRAPSGALVAAGPAGVRTP